jgi:AraC family transcriptional regulator of adaptative response/methylated-DNA-[protein]-cysteine methyltransferase
MQLLPPVDEMQRAFLASDASYNGVFYTAVRTTGIFCLPACPAKKPRPENVEFFATVKDALFAGYRACKRCRPTENAAPVWVQELLARLDTSTDERIREAALREMGLDPGRVRRQFLHDYGMTFQAYCRARRLGKAFESIRDGKALDQTVFDSGFDSHSGFRSAFARVFGTPPGQVRGGDCIRLSWVQTPMGPMVAGAVDGGICLLEFTERRMLETQFDILRRRFQMPMVPGRNGAPGTVAQRIGRVLRGNPPEIHRSAGLPGDGVRTRGLDASVGDSLRRNALV